MSINKPLRGRVKPHSEEERRLIVAGLLLAGAILLLDQVTKVLITHKFGLYECLPVIPGCFNLRYVVNQGAAWSLLSGYTFFLLFIAVAVATAMLYFLRSLTEGYVERYLGLFLVLGGIVGNSIDRLFRGGVVDFLDCYIRIGGKTYSWPTFNVADCAICVGVGVFLLSVLFRPETKDKAAPKAPADGNNDNAG